MLKTLVTEISHRRPGFDTGFANIWFLVKRHTGTDFSPSTHVFLCQYLQTNAPYSSLS